MTSGLSPERSSRSYSPVVSPLVPPAARTRLRDLSAAGLIGPSTDTATRTKAGGTSTSISGGSANKTTASHVSDTANPTVAPGRGSTGMDSTPATATTAPTSTSDPRSTTSRGLRVVPISSAVAPTPSPGKTRMPSRCGPSHTATRAHGTARSTARTELAVAAAAFTCAALTVVPAPGRWIAAWIAGVACVLLFLGANR